MEAAMALDAYDHVYSPGAPGAPTLAMLHGSGGDKEGFAALAARLAPQAGVLALDGDVFEGNARRFFRRRAEGVYDMDDLMTRAARLGAFLAEASAYYGIEPARLAGVGYSNGANILATLAMTGGAAPRRLVLMHPLIPFEAATRPDLSGTAVLITAGRRDPICPPPLTERLGATFGALGARATTFWHEGGHDVTAAELAAAAAFLREPGAQAA
jgi:phospholipase/carboxylesterase